MFLLQDSRSAYILCGVCSYVFFFAFFDRLKSFFVWNRKLTERIFSFFHPFIKVAYFTVPIWVILIGLAGLFISMTSGKSEILFNLSLFLLGFFISLHLVLSAQSLKPSSKPYFNIDYLFALVFIFLVGAVFFLISLKPFFENLQITSVFYSSFLELKGTAVSIYQQLFIPKKIG